MRRLKSAQVNTTIRRDETRSIAINKTSANASSKLLERVKGATDSQRCSRQFHNSSGRWCGERCVRFMDSNNAFAASGSRSGQSDNAFVPWSRRIDDESQTGPQERTVYQYSHYEQLFSLQASIVLVACKLAPGNNSPNDPTKGRT